MPTDPRPSSTDWNRRRWEWQRQVLADADLNDKAKLVAAAMVSQFFDMHRAEFSPGYTALAKALSTSLETIKRAIRALEAGGWLVRSGGGHRGKEMTMECHFPGESNGQADGSSSPEKGVKSDPLYGFKGGQSCTPFPKERGSNRARKGVKSDPHYRPPPAPPYKDKNKYLQSARDARTRGPLSCVIPANGDAHRAWDAWLLPRGHPSLSQLARSVPAENGAGFEVPMKRPPDDDGTTQAVVAARWVRAMQEGIGNG